MANIAPPQSVLAKHFQAEKTCVKNKFMESDQYLAIIYIAATLLLKITSNNL